MILQALTEYYRVLADRGVLEAPGWSSAKISFALCLSADGTLEQVILAGFSHAPAVELAERLLAIAPRQAGRAPLAKVFYADNGSAGVEVALKMAFHWFRNRGEHARTKFVALENGYHGETLGALAVGDIPLYRRIYAPLLAEALFAPSPDAWKARPGESAAQCASRAADALADLFDRHPGEVCAVIVEPRLQCAGGMRMHDPVYLQRARELCDANGAFLIADEIATGFGRTLQIDRVVHAHATGALQTGFENDRTDLTRMLVEQVGQVIGGLVGALCGTLTWFGQVGIR